MKLDNVEAICDALNEYAEANGFFAKPAVDIDRQAGDFVNDFAKANGLSAHTVSPDRWWFASREFGMIEDGEVELYPLIRHAVEKLHPHDDIVQKQFKPAMVPKTRRDQ